MIIIHGQKANAVDVNIGLDVPARIDLSVYHTDTLLRSEMIIGTLGMMTKRHAQTYRFGPAFDASQKVVELRRNDAC